MDPQALDATFKMHFAEIRQRLDRAASSGRAAETCALADNVDTAVQIALDIEVLIHEVTTFLNAACLIHRIHKN